MLFKIGIVLAAAVVVVVTLVNACADWALLPFVCKKYPVEPGCVGKIAFNVPVGKSFVPKVRIPGLLPIQQEGHPKTYGPID